MRGPRVSMSEVTVINDSVPWKEDLLRVALALEQRTTQRRWTERTSYLVERDIMIGAYAIRRLDESRKISDQLRSKSVRVRRYDLKGKPLDVWTRHEFYEHYDMGLATEVDLSLGDFCNQVIHSWIWALSATERQPRRFDGVFVSSDRARKLHLYFLSAATLIELFRAVGGDDIVQVVYRHDREGVANVVSASRNLSPSDSA